MKLLVLPSAGSGRGWEERMVGVGMDGDAVQFHEVGKNEGNHRRNSDGLLCLYRSLLNFFRVSRHSCFKRQS